MEGEPDEVCDRLRRSPLAVVADLSAGPLPEGWALSLVSLLSKAKVEGRIDKLPSVGVVMPAVLAARTAGRVAR